MPAAGSHTFIPAIFLHFLDRYHFVLARELLAYPTRVIVAEMQLAYRLAFLLSDSLYLSASAYFENPVARGIIKRHAPFYESGHVFLTARDETLREHFERKQSVHYADSTSPALKAAYSAFSSVAIPYRSVDISTAKAITERWRGILESGHLVDFLDRKRTRPDRSDLERLWERIPDVLGSRAFVLPHVVSSFEQLGVAPPSDIKLLSILDPGYTLSHAVPLNCGLVHDLVYIEPPWTVSRETRGISFKQSRDALIRYELLSVLQGASADDLLRLRNSGAWSVVAPAIEGIAEPDASFADALGEIRRSLLAGNARGVTWRRHRRTSRIGVITALPEEWQAMIAAFGARERTPVENDPNRYATAVLAQDGTSGTPLEVVITFLPRMANNSASVVTTNMLRSFPDIDDILFVGIACGCPNPRDAAKHVRLGDIVVSDLQGLVQLDHQAIRDGQAHNRSAMPPPSRRLLNAVRLLQGDETLDVRPWESSLASLTTAAKIFRRPSAATDVVLDVAGDVIRHPRDTHRRKRTPRVFHGVIGSWNTLLRDHQLRDRLAGEHNLRAIEMEGAGTAEAVWQFGKSYLIVRGICDYGDDRTKSDRWHGYAAAAAASYAKSLLQRLSQS
jgi:nucleoside phosphorylase